MFPDFVRIDQVKDDIIDVLNGYSKQLEIVTNELDESARNAESIRESIKSTKEKFIVLPVLKRCEICDRKLLTRQYHVFPCFHAFHSDCLIEQLLKHPIKCPRIRLLQSEMGNDKKQREELELLLGEECILCGDFMIRSIDQLLTDEPDIL
jgi:vacuolar protein sorting-associated protein 18